MTVVVVNASKESEVDMDIRPVLGTRENQVGETPATVKVRAPQKLIPSWLPRF